MIRLLMNRSVSKVNDEWFADEERVRASVGLLEKPATSKRQSQREVLLCNHCIPLQGFAVFKCLSLVIITFFYKTSDCDGFDR